MLPLLVERMKTLAEFAKSQGIPVMAAHDVYYIKPEDRFARETLVRVNSHSDASEKISDSDEDDFVTSISAPRPS